MRNQPSSWRKALLLSAALCAPAAAWAQSDVTQPGDPIIASSANSPGSEGVANAIDGKTTKYLNFDSGRDGNQTGTFSPSGFVVTPAAGVTRVTGMALQSANDGPERDPDIVTIEGSNDDAVTDFASGNWTQIARIENIAAGITARFQRVEFSFENLKPYKHYRWTAQAVRTVPNGCCMQVAEVELLGSVVAPDVTQPGDAILASSANSPGSEGVANAIDNKTTKYLNFDSGRDGNQTGTFSPSGFVVTPGIGRSLINGITMQSANDGPERDPDIITIEGSNDETIASYNSGTWEQVIRIEGIAAGFTARFQKQTFLFDNFKPYRHYRWVAQSVRTVPNGCCMQVAEIELHGTAEPQDVTQPGDVIFASSANSPGSEGVANVIDNKTTKYLNFDSGRDGNQTGTFSPSGFAVSPGIGASTVIGMTIQSANDGPERDPDTVLLEGSNDDTLTSYSSGTWTPITTITGIAAGFTARFQKQEFFFANTKSYKHYRWVVQAVRTVPNGCCMQVAEVELLAPINLAPDDAAFLAQPVNTPALDGQPATFIARLNGPWPVQWKKNGEVIPGATKPVYTTGPVTAANQADIYTVEIIKRTPESSLPVQATVFTPSTFRSIGISFVGGGANGAPTTVLPTDITGLHPQAYWNNANAGSGDLPDPNLDPPVDYVDSNNQVTDITFNFVSSGTWGSGTGVETPTDRMLNGNTEDAVGGDPATYTFSNVPAGQHTVLVYVVSPPLVFSDVNYKVTGATEQTYYITAMNSDQYNPVPGYYRGFSTDPARRTLANYVRFENVSPAGGAGGTITVSVDNQTTGQSRNTGVNGIQLVLGLPPAGTPPTITTQPSATLVKAGKATELSVVVDSSTPATYQWRKDGRNLANGGNVSGANTAKLRISSAAEANEGVYSVAVFNSAGSSLSRNAALRLSAFTANENLVAHLKFNETSGASAANTASAANPGAITGTSGWGAGKVANSLGFDGATYVVVPNYTKAVNELSVAGWVNVDAATTTAAPFIRNALGGLSVGGVNSGQFDFGIVANADTGAMHVQASVVAGPNIVTALAPAALALGSWQHVAFSADGSALHLYINGVEVATTEYLDRINQPNVATIAFGAVLTRNIDDPSIIELDANAVPLAGRLDDFAVWTRALGANEPGLIVAAGNTGAGLETIVIPEPSEPTSGTPPTLTVTRTGGNITISWDQPGFTLQSSDRVNTGYANVAGVTGSSFTTPAEGAPRFYRMVQ